MHRNRTILWALLLIGVGVFLLLQNADLISNKVEVWPLVLIAIGVWLLLERSLFGSRWGGGYVWPFLLIGIGTVLLLEDLDALPDQDVLVPVIVIAIGLGLALSAISQNRSRAVGEEQVRIPLEDAHDASLRLDHGAGRLRVRAADSPDLVEGRFGGGAETEVRRTGGRLDVTVRARNGMPWGPGREHGLEWDLTVSRRVPMSLELRTGANEGDLDLTDLRLTELRIQTGASTTVVRLPSTGRYSVRVQGGAMSIRLEVPSGVAARVEARAGLSNVRVDPHRFPKWGGEWRSGDYETAQHRADIHLETGAAKVEVL